MKTMIKLQKCNKCEIKVAHNIDRDVVAGGWFQQCVLCNKITWLQTNGKPISNHTQPIESVRSLPKHA